MNRDRSTFRRRGRQAWLLLMAVALGGCGYQHKPLFPTDVRSVGVRIFENRSFYQGLEFDVTEALIKEIELRTPYKVVKPEVADTVLEGTINSVGQTTLSRRRKGGLAQELEFRVDVSFTWRDMRGGRNLRQRQGLVAVGRYVPAEPVGQTYVLAQHQAAQQLATDIVTAMGSDW